jgi:hypothetical protein
MGSFDPWGKDSDRHKVFSCYCQPARENCVGGTTPPKGPSHASTGAQRCSTTRGADGVKNGVARWQGEGNLRVKRSDP